MEEGNMKKLYELLNNIPVTLENSETKFIMVMDSLKAPKEEVKAKTKTDNKSFWDRVKDLFK